MKAKKAGFALVLAACLLAGASACDSATESEMADVSQKIEVVSDDLADPNLQLQGVTASFSEMDGLSFAVYDAETDTHVLLFQEVYDAAGLSEEEEDASLDMTEAEAGEEAFAAAFSEEDMTTEEEILQGPSEPVESESVRDQTESVPAESEPSGDPESAKEEEDEQKETEPELDPLTEFVKSHVLTNDEKFSSTLNIRSGPGTDYEIVGRFYPGSCGQVLDSENGWIKISSGNVTGWVSSDYLITEEEELTSDIIRKQTCRGTVATQALNVRREPGLDSEVIGSMEKGEECTILSFTDNGWAEVNRKDGFDGYVSADYLSVSFYYSDAMTLEEEEAYLAELARIEEEKKRQEEEEERKRLAANAVSLSESDMRLMACVVDMEAIGEPYAAKLGVANVILNRYRNGWGSISGIIYQNGQFPGASSGLLAGYLAKGPSSSSMQAVRDACAGNNNVPGFNYFCSASSAKPSAYKSSVTLGRLCFYQK